MSSLKITRLTVFLYSIHKLCIKYRQYHLVSYFSDFSTFIVLLLACTCKTFSVNIQLSNRQIWLVAAEPGFFTYLNKHIRFETYETNGNEYAWEYEHPHMGRRLWRVHKILLSLFTNLMACTSQHFAESPFATFWVIWMTHRQTDYRQKLERLHYLCRR